MVSVNLRPGEGRRTGASRRRRPKTVGLRRLVRERHLRVLGHDEDDDLDVDVEAEAEADADNAGRPRVRADCKCGPRPCPWVSCRHHLALDVSDFGALKLNFPGLAPGELPTSCALDVAERGGLSLEEVGGLLNVTRERARQIEVSALRKLWQALIVR